MKLIERLRIESRIASEQLAGVPGVVADGIRALAALCAEAADDLEREAARLDYIERTRCYPFWDGGQWKFFVSQERSTKIERRGVGATVREAIDAAMKP